MKNPLVSIVVIDYKKSNSYLIECLNAVGKQTYTNFEIILESDHLPLLPSPLRRGRLGRGLRIVSYHGCYRSPAFKRDHAGQIAKGEILAFIDDDAYPDRDWLKNMVRNFSQDKITGVAGPGITPPGVGWQEAASGWMSASPLGAGSYAYRFFPAKLQFVDDYPSMNLAVRRADFLAVGGYDSHYWPGEDTKLCLDLVSKPGKKIIYHPKVLVYHHRRPLWLPHLKQNGSFGLHRGFFARVLPRTSLRLVYLGPPFMLLGLLYLLLSAFIPTLNTRYYLLTTAGKILFSVYLLSLAANSVWVYQKSKSPFQGFLSFFVVFLTHLWYGARFLQGFFFTRKLIR